MAAKYDRFGLDYNCTRQADPYISNKFYSYLNPETPGVYLDIGCGTGNYTNALNKKDFTWIGIDPSIQMLAEAKNFYPDIEWKNGSAEHIPLNENTIDGAIAMLTLHHWDNLEQGFSELHRVSKPNSRFVIFTSTPRQMKHYWLNHYFPKMMVKSIVQMPPLRLIEHSLQTSGWTIKNLVPYSIRPDQIDFFLYAGKYNPSAYLSDKIRKGISSFSDLANLDEVSSGLSSLEADIASGAIHDMISNEEQEGDYLFIIAEAK